MHIRRGGSPQQEVSERHQNLAVLASYQYMDSVAVHHIRKGWSKNEQIGRHCRPGFYVERS